jgi:hypothetical protein
MTVLHSFCSHSSDKRRKKMGMLCNAVFFLFFKKYNIVTDNVLFMKASVIRSLQPSSHTLNV